MAFVHTAHGPGRIIATETVRGRTRHKVAGAGFEVWLDAVDVREASLGDINEDNSTTLPYNPEPQYPSDMWAHDTTIQPGEQEIDKDERLSPSDSIDFDSRSNRSFPGPDPALFAKNSSLDYEAGIKEWWDSLDTKHKEPLEVSDVVIPRGMREKMSEEEIEQYLRDNPVGRVDEHDKHKTHANLGSKYATWMLASPEGDDSVSRFRRDPYAEINRLGYLWTGGMEDPEMADYGRLVEADKMLREAAWTDVRQKAQRLRREGRVHVLHRGPGNIYANVEGDNGTYTTMIAKTGNTQSIDKWACSCDWGRWAFQRKISYVGRLCSHGYASYLELQSDEHKGNPGRFHQPKRTASVTDDFQDYVDDFRNGNIDIDAADNFITLPQHSQKEDPFTEDEVQDIYDYARDNATTREPRNYKMPYYAATEDGNERAKVLRTHPMSLTPDLIEVPRGEDPYFVDVTEDERETTGPGQIVTGSLVDALGNVYTPGNFWRTADESTSDAPVEDETKKKPATPTAPSTSGQDSSSAGQSSSASGEKSTTSGQVSDPNVATPRVPDAAPAQRKDESYGSDPMAGGMDMNSFTSLAGPVIDTMGSFAAPLAEGIGSAIGNIGSGILGNRRYAEDGFTNENGYEVPVGDLEKLRALSDEDPDLGNTDSRNREISDLVDELHDEGFDASQIVASYGLGNQGQGQPGGAFLQPGGGSWADRAFSGSGPDPKYWFGTSEDLIDRGAEHIDEVDVTEGTGETNHWNESERPAQGKKKSGRYLFANDNDMRDELLQSVGEEIEGIGQYNQFLDEAHELGDDQAAATIQEAIDDEQDHVENFTDALERTSGMNDVVRRFQASGGGALANDSGGNQSDDAIANQARKFLAKTAGRVYSLAEQQALIEESHPQGARNKPTDDDLAGTHYV